MQLLIVFIKASFKITLRILYFHFWKDEEQLINVLNIKIDQSFFNENIVRY